MFCVSVEVSVIMVACISWLTRSMTVSTLIRLAMWPTKYTRTLTHKKASRMAMLSDRCGVKTPSCSVRTLRRTM